MKCPQCGGSDLSVQDSRPGEDEVRRRRVCGGCGTRYMTAERIVDVYVAAAPGRPSTRPKVKPAPEVKNTKKPSVKRTEARRKIEDMRDTFEEDYSMYDDLADVGHLWK